MMKDAKIIQIRTISIFKEYQMNELQEKQSQLNELTKNEIWFANLSLLNPNMMNVFYKDRIMAKYT